MTPEILRKRARDALVVEVLSLFCLGIPFVFWFVPVFGFGAAWSAQSADRQLLTMKEKPTWAGVFAVPLGILVGLIGCAFVASAIASLLDH